MDKIITMFSKETQMDSKQIVRQIDITRIKNNQPIIMEDSIIDEEILEIVVNQDKAFEMVFSMTHTRELVAGFLFTQGIVRHKTDIENFSFSKNTKTCHISLNRPALKRLDEVKNGRSIKGSSGGALLPGAAAMVPADPFHGFQITYDQVLALIQQHWDQSGLFHETGALHSAGICSPTTILSYYEDIGRHNALDKMAGAIFLNGIKTTDKVATVSCRMSLEIIGKIIKTGIPVVISNAAPTLSAVQLADKAGLTVIGFARNKRFNIYTHKQRIIPDKA